MFCSLVRMVGVYGWSLGLHIFLLSFESFFFKLRIFLPSKKKTRQRRCCRRRSCSLIIWKNIASKHFLFPMDHCCCCCWNICCLIFWCSRHTHTHTFFHGIRNLEIVTLNITLFFHIQVWKMERLHQHTHTPVNLVFKNTKNEIFVVVVVVVWINSSHVEFRMCWTHLILTSFFFFFCFPKNQTKSN